MIKKKKVLNSVRYDRTPYFNEDELDLFRQMAILCVKFRICSNISINRMRGLYAKIKELSE